MIKRHVIIGYITVDVMMIGMKPIVESRAIFVNETVCRIISPFIIVPIDGKTHLMLKLPVSLFLPFPG